MVVVISAAPSKLNGKSSLHPAKKHRQSFDAGRLTRRIYLDIYGD